MASQFKRRDVIAIVVTALTLLVVVMLPALGRAKQKAARISCVSNLKHIGLAFTIYAHDNVGVCPMNVDSNDPSIRNDALAGRMFRIFQVMSNELSVPKTVVCPADNRSAAVDWPALTNSNLSYFVGLDAVDARPNMLLSGDRNWMRDGQQLSGVVELGSATNLTYSEEMHRSNGNIGLADGSVQQVTTKLFLQQLANSGDATNRLVFPQ